MVEIRELVVRVNVTDDLNRSKETVSIDKNALVNACVKQVLRKLDKRKRR